LEQFTNNVDAVTYCGGSIGMAIRLSKSLANKRGIDITVITAAKKRFLRMEAQNRYPATVFILGANQVRYSGLIRDIKNSFLNRTDTFPRTITAVYNLLVNWKEDPSKQPQGVVSNGIAFTNDGMALAQPARAKKDIATIKCYNCGELGHYFSDCPKPRKQRGDQLLMAGIESGKFDDNGHQSSFAFINNAEGHRSDGRNIAVTFNSNQGRIPKTWILLDNQSTVDVFHNDGLLERI
jgi:hypothetical protein